MQADNERSADLLEKSRQELYSLIEQGLEDERCGRVVPLSEAIDSIRRELNLPDSTQN